VQLHVEAVAIEEERRTQPPQQVDRPDREPLASAQPTPAGLKTHRRSCGLVVDREVVFHHLDISTYGTYPCEM
jgi:hypothetical protein